METGLAPGGGGEVHPVLRSSSVRDDRRMFLGRKILASIFSGSLIQVGIFLSTQNNLKIRDSSWYDPHVSRLCSSFGNFYGSKIRHGIFWGVKFWSRDFLGFV